MCPSSSSGPRPGAAAETSVPGSPVTGSRVARTRERLFLVALKRFREEGFDAVSVSEITREAGVAKGTFFNHFPTKDHVLAESFRRAVDTALEDVSRREAAGTEAILHLVGVLTELLSQDPGVLEAVALGLGSLPSAREGEPREVERIRRWIQARLGEALPFRVPLVEPGSAALSFHLVWAVQGGIECWVREEGGGDTLRESVLDRVRFLLASAGFPVDTL